MMSPENIDLTLGVDIKRRELIEYLRGIQVEPEQVQKLRKRYRRNQKKAEDSEYYRGVADGLFEILGTLSWVRAEEMIEIEEWQGSNSEIVLTDEQAGNLVNRFYEVNSLYITEKEENNIFNDYTYFRGKLRTIKGFLASLIGISSAEIRRNWEDLDLNMNLSKFSQN